MSVKRIALTILVAGAVLLAVGAGTGVAGSASALPVKSEGVIIPYAGRLSEEAGQPVAEGTYDLTFALYAAESGGEPLWSELQAGVPVKGGSFSVSLGSVTPIPTTLLDGRTLWLAVAVRGPGEAGFTALTPRQRVSAAAPAAARQSAACPHDHFGELWEGADPLQGLKIHNTGAGDGLTVDVDDPSSAALLVVHTEGTGVYVADAYRTGMFVSSAGEDGVLVYEAGAPGAHNASSWNNGFQIDGAEGSGLYVGYAGMDGVTVQSAEWYGVYVAQADFDGVRVDSAGNNGVYAVSNSAMYYGGVFYNTAAGGAGLYAAGGDNTAPDLELGVYGAGDDGRIYSLRSETGSDLLLFSNDETHVHLDEDDNSGSAFVIYNGANTAIWTVGEKGAVTIGTDAGAYGPRAAYPVRATGDWIEDFGTAELVDGQATVTIEPVFAQMVSLSKYQVFLTPLGDCPLYIAAKTPASFTVKAMGGQRCSIAFDYRLVAKRLGNEGARLEPVDISGEEQED